LDRETSVSATDHAVRERADAGTAPRRLNRALALLVSSAPLLAPLDPAMAAPSPISMPAVPCAAGDLSSDTTSDQGAMAVGTVVVTAKKPASAVQTKNQALDEARDKQLLPKLGATTYGMDQQAIETLPQGENTPLDKVLLQAPGVSYDSAISNPDFHIRNEYANVQYRINGIQLPDGVSALGPVLETGIVGNLDLLDGALPAEYGLRTAGVVDITTKGTFDQGGDLDVTGGTWSTLSSRIEYGGSAGQTQYFLTGQYMQSAQGLENATPAENPIHDQTTQEKFFGYGSTLLGDSSRLTYMAGGFVGQFQIPDVAGEAPLGDFGPSNLSSANINENETDQFYFGLIALQTYHDTLDTQVSIFTRYASTDFTADVFNDLAFNDVASDVTRKSLLGGLQFDASDRLNDSNTLRAGFVFNIERTQVDDLSTLLPLGPGGAPLPTPVTVNDATSKLGWTLGGYVQDEWAIRHDLTLDMGVRFDQIDQFVSANQFSPRVALVYKPVAGTTLHAGVSRYFTPPMQAQATPANLALFQNTVQQPAIPLDDPVRPERASYVDVGVDQTLLAGLTAGVDAYDKSSTDTLDDGQFGQAVVLEQFNYARGYSRGVELKINYVQGGFRTYANLSDEVTKVEDVVSHQYLIGDPVELAFLAKTYTYASDAQTLSASWGASYRWRGLLATIDGIYGSGLRAGFANEQHSPDYTQWNAAVAQRFDLWHDGRPMTLRLSAINLFDSSYLLRGATGIGEFAPQFGPRRGVFAELSQPF
jgi:outer membrane receptor protein involved in Fe transport